MIGVLVIVEYFAGTLKLCLGLRYTKISQFSNIAIRRPTLVSSADIVGDLVDFLGHTPLAVRSVAKIASFSSQIAKKSVR